MSYIKTKREYPRSKYIELKKYISDGDKIFKKDILKMGFTRVDVTLYNYCKRNKLYLRKVNSEYWIKDYTAKRYDILSKKNKILYMKKDAENTKRYNSK